MSINNLDVDFKALRPGVTPPAYASDGAAGLDLVYAGDVPLNVFPGDTVKIGLGFAMHIKSKEIGAFLLPRSGLGTKGLVLGNGTGVIDSDYQGEVIVAVTNRNKPGAGPFAPNEPITINPGDRFAQMVFMPVFQARFTVVDEFAVETERGTGGFGSTGS